jgi:hypothetical protein
MVFQGDNMMTASINYFGPPHQVVALDGLFLMCRWGVLKYLLKKPDYLTSNWDFYDIHLTLSAHLDGYNNFAVPLIVMHESDGFMRPDWFVSLEEFSREFAQHLPCRVAKGKLPWII